MTHYYYSVASKEYTYKLIILYNSMLRNDKYFKFFIICLNSDSKRVLEKFKLKNAVLIGIEELEAYDPELASVKDRRNTKQYAWAAKPIAALYILDKYPGVDHIIWLDGDTKFLSSPEPIYSEWGTASVALTEEKFTGKYQQTAEIYGVYNTGFMGFKRDETGIGCLRYFREKILEWNYDEKEQYRWNDQLYVSDWPERFVNIGIIKNPGVNMTPFIFNRLLDETGSSLSIKEGSLFMGDTKITLFHLYGLSYFNRQEFELCYYTDIYCTPEIKLIYLPYLKEAIKTIAKIRSIDRDFYPEQPVDIYNIRNYYRLNDKGKQAQQGEF